MSDNVVYDAGDVTARVRFFALPMLIAYHKPHNYTAPISSYRPEELPYSNLIV
jgi:hypothetical protein